MRAADRYAIDDLGIPSLVLMEVAGRAVAAAALRSLPSRIVALAGTGNNGADALVAARHLAEAGRALEVIIVGQLERASPDLVTQLGVLRRLGVRCAVAAPEEALARVSKMDSGPRGWVDGLFGVGLSRDITGARAALIRAVQAREDPVVAVDLPSGVDADTGQVLGVALPARVTVTFQEPKRGHALHPGRVLSGEVEIADIGIPNVAVTRLPPCVRASAAAALWPDARPADGHKKNFGHVLAVTGHRDRLGATLLVARGASRGGAGLVTIGGDEEAVARLAGALGSLMARSLGRSAIDWGRLGRESSAFDAVVVGPSLSPGAATDRGLRHAFADGVTPLVLDAGALRSVQAEWVEARPGPTVLTPHPGEMAQLLGCATREVQRDRIEAARSCARRYGAVVALKGASTVVASPRGEARVCLRGNPGMSAAGTGDVLAGVAAAQLAGGQDPFEAVERAVMLHAMAGDRIARVRAEWSMCAEDLIDGLGEPLRFHDV